LVGLRRLAQELEGFKMNESPVAREWRAKARLEGEREGQRKGELKGQVRTLVRVLEGRFGKVPDELLSAISASTDSGQLDGWALLAGSPSITTLDLFRQQARI
jgi:hypothetical protein